MDLPAAAVGILARYLAEIGAGAAHKLGENAVDAARKLLILFRGKMSENRQETLKDFEAEPASADTQAALRQAIRKTIEADRRFAEELQSILPPEANLDTMTQNVSGDNAKAVQIKGSRNTTSID